MTTRLDVYTATVEPSSVSPRTQLRLEIHSGIQTIIGALSPADEDRLLEVLAQRREHRDFPPETP